MIDSDKNRAPDRFVTSGARVSQVRWPVNQVFKLGDLSAHLEQVVRPTVSFPHIIFILSIAQL
jgi:hypothetical protein